jgi:hypothetical protein
MLASASIPLPMRWKLKASPSGRLLFQLALLGRRTKGTAFGLLPTPMASDCKGATDNCKKVKKGDTSYLRYFLHFYLKPEGSSWPHPSFVERMMGYPIGHTVLEPSETLSFRRSRRSSAKPSCDMKNRRFDA